MKRNQIRQIQVHFVPSPDGKTVAERANQYHLQIIERRLEESALTPRQKTEVLVQIAEHIKALS